MSSRVPKELTVDELHRTQDPQAIGVESTDDISAVQTIVGQERALRSLDFGLHVKADGYNIYIAGSPGTGKSTVAMAEIERLAAQEQVPDDICYLYNFEKPDEPSAVRLPAGKGTLFRQDMKELTEDLEDQIEKAFSGEDYAKQRKGITDKIDAEREKFSGELQKAAQERGFSVQQSPVGIFIVPLREGSPVQEEEFDKLPDERKAEMRSAQEDVQSRIMAESEKLSILQRQAKEELRELDRKVALNATGHLLASLRAKYGKYDHLTRYLDGVRNDILENLDVFKKEERPAVFPFQAGSGPSKDDILRRYSVNLLVNNSDTKGAPVIVEHNPTYYNITGQVEYRATFGVLTTDFTMIKAGAAHRANGGYLVIRAEEILKDYFAWDSLKRILHYKHIKIENIAQRYGLAPANGLKPQPVDVNLRVVILGSPLIYHLLYAYEREFPRLFRVKVDFDPSIPRDGEHVNAYVRYVSTEVRKGKLLPFDKTGIARVIDYGSRAVSHKGKLSSSLLEIGDLLHQADYWARAAGASQVSAGYVDKAWDERVYRSSMIEEKIDEMIQEGTIRVSVSGREVGQVNGLSILALGDYSFGKPSRISAATYIGKGSIVNIEREVELSGKIHSKGVLILSGYLGATYAQRRPLALSASLAFEQLYDEVDGDSASSAELYCLLSSLSGVALRQDLAVTGSVDQRGRVQAVGGVNEKIEGFFSVCKKLGFTGSQGVLIPLDNARHLMLRGEVLEAVRNGIFHVYAAETIDQGLALLTGMEAGERMPDGTFPDGTFHHEVESKLDAFAQVLAQYRAQQEQPVHAVPV